MALTPEQTGFLRRHLGFRGGPAGGAPRLLPIWQRARDATNDQLGKLEGALRGHGMPLFARIADKGLNGVTEGQLVALQAALMDCDAAAGEVRGRAVEKARGAVGGMRSFLASNPVLPLLDDNPLGIAVSIRATLSAALDEVETALGR